MENYVHYAHGETKVRTESQPRHRSEHEIFIPFSSYTTFKYLKTIKIKNK